MHNAKAKRPKKNKLTMAEINFYKTIPGGGHCSIGTGPNTHKDALRVPQNKIHKYNAVDHEEDKAREPNPDERGLTLKLQRVSRRQPHGLQVSEKSMSRGEEIVFEGHAVFMNFFFLLG